jgi:hypothetical protein
VLRKERKAVEDATDAIRDYSGLLTVGVGLALAVSVVALVIAVNK